MARKRFKTGTLEYSTEKIKGIFAKRFCVTVRYVKTGFNNSVTSMKVTDTKINNKL